MAIVSVRPVPHQERGCAHGCFNVCGKVGPVVAESAQ